MATDSRGEVGPGFEDVRDAFAGNFAELDRRFETGFDLASSSSGLDDLRPPAGLFLVATLRAEPVGCGGLIFHGNETADVKRMWVAGRARGLGVHHCQHGHA